MIRFGDATVTYTPDGCVTTFDDGASYGAQPHNTPDYDEIARRCGYWEDWPGLGPILRAQARLRYCRDHEACHLIVEREFMGGQGGVIRKLARGEPIDPGQAAMEELTVMSLQRWLRANERPIVGGVRWDVIKTQALALMGPCHADR